MSPDEDDTTFSGEWFTDADGESWMIPTSALKSCPGAGSWPVNTANEPLADGTTPVGRCPHCRLPVAGFLEIPEHQPRKEQA